MLLLLLNYVVLRALWKIDVHLISTLVTKSCFIIIIIIIKTNRQMQQINIINNFTGVKIHFNIGYTVCGRNAI